MHPASNGAGRERPFDNRFPEDDDTDDELDVRFTDRQWSEMQGMMTRSRARRVRRRTRRSEDKFFGKLSDDLVLCILEKLATWPDKQNASAVCKRWRRLCESPRLWRSVRFAYNPVAALSVPREALQLLERTQALQHLQTLDLAYVSAADEDVVRAVPRGPCAATLTSVDLTCCPGATDKSVVELSRCPRLRVLRLAHNVNVTRRSVRILAVRCPRLAVLDLSFIPNIRDSLLLTLASSCCHLAELSVAGSHGVSVGGVRALVKGCPHLTSLNFALCVRIDDDTVKVVGEGCPKLRSIDLSDTEVTDMAVVTLIKHCKLLNRLVVDSCPAITDASVNIIVEMAANRMSNIHMCDCPNVTDVAASKLIDSLTTICNIHLTRTPRRYIANAIRRRSNFITVFY